MKVAAYVQVRRMRNPTGVGQHLIHMIDGISRTSDVQVSVLASRRDLDATGSLPAPLWHVGVTPLPLRRKWLEGSWWALNWPDADRWCPGADWVYSPAEAYIATRNVPLAVTVHDTHAFEPHLPWSNTPDHQRFRKRWELLFRSIRQRAKLIITVSQFTKSRLVTLLGFDPSRIEVVGNGVDERYFDPMTPIDLPPEPYLYVIGGLTRRKGGDQVIELAKGLKSVRPDLRILVSGIGEKDLERQADAVGNIRRLGYVSLERQAGLLSGSQLLLFLSRYEGFGIPAIEAMAAGTPAVVSESPALQEVVGNAALVVDSSKPEAVLESVLRLERDNSLRRVLIERGRWRADEFRWGKCVDRLLTALRRHL
jgi:glycosyltransferase involved in cell wall biosynthesis